ncbi:hypothetical protein GOD47_01410 [Sinorhizobium medicae]|nr:hypothetical protein [Sinorhizobium medicae]MDX0662672.1 hypothetical protein [Sinorhizobium medicae]MDX0723723.1 hypothetical protein [Sinorhizobium medicae]MDX0729797.1 hypothetical protein [Sinorhizobium medicae]MDX0809886.1 hypothetical protein [Sinorhizobium medicae]
MSKREFSKISPAVWRSERFTTLDTDAKLLHLYLISCEHQNSAGCFRLPDGYACSDLGWEMGKYREARDRLIADDLASFDAQTAEIYVHRWFKHNPPMNDKHAIGTRSIIERIESDAIREKVEAEFQTADDGRASKAARLNEAVANGAHLTNTSLMMRGVSR